MRLPAYLFIVCLCFTVCPAEMSDLITRPEVIAPRIGNSTPIVVNGQCVENSSGIGARLTCSQNGVWGGLDVVGCICDIGFHRSLDGRSCVGTYLPVLFAQPSIDQPLVPPPPPPPPPLPSPPHSLPTPSPPKVVMLGCTCLSTSPAFPALLTATAHNEGCPSAPALRDTSELLENLQKGSVLVSVTLVQARVVVMAVCNCNGLQIPL